ncbi:hypothetical protein BJY01DRAFT_254764 [Aspergillus pseudoustus]|uniref:Uncharacterized protein n=1 Tax=Aspergillus pseudoustus TaxID=1810923 RepID=A0ABR4ITC7_9EURO
MSNTPLEATGCQDETKIANSKPSHEELQRLRAIFRQERQELSRLLAVCRQENQETSQLYDKNHKVLDDLIEGVDHLQRTLVRTGQEISSSKKQVSPPRSPIVEYRECSARNAEI